MLGLEGEDHRTCNLVCDNAHAKVLNGAGMPASEKMMVIGYTHSNIIVYSNRSTPVARIRSCPMALLLEVGSKALHW